MTDFLAQIITWINTPINILGNYLLAPISYLHGWLSITIISAITGVVLLIIFKYTSNQKAIGQIRDNISAHMLSIKLFKDSFTVTLQAQVRIFSSAFHLLLYSACPLLLMILPVSFSLGQLGVWYQKRPLHIGETSIVTLKLNGISESRWPDISIETMPALEVLTGPVKVLSKGEVHWKIKANANGYHNIVFKTGKLRVEKELVVGDHFMRVSQKRPGWRWTDILLHPLEKPFKPKSIVHSISIDYPDRPSFTSGTDWWLVYFFIVSMLFALIYKPFLKVRI